MEVEVSDKECGDERVQVKGKECGEGRGVVDVVVEVNKPPCLGAGADIDNEDRRVGSQVFTGSDLEFVTSERMAAVMDARVDHHFRALLMGKEWIVEFPFGVGSSSEDISSVDGCIASSDTDRVKPGFLNQQ